MNQSQVRDLLNEQAFFGDFSDAVLDLFAEHASERSLETNEVLFGNADPANHFYFVQEGGITIEVPAIEGPSLEIQCLEPGQVLGWSWLIPPYRWSFQARANAPTRLITFDGEAIRKRCDADEAIGYAVLKRFASLMSERLDAARRRMMDEWTPPGFA